MNNIIQFPSSSSILHNKRYKITDEALDFIWDGLKTPSKRQFYLMEKRLKIANKIESYLPRGSKLLDEYDSLHGEDTQILVDSVVNYMVEHEAEIKDKIVGY